MKLRYSPTSPFVRKVRIVALETGLEGLLEPVPANPWAPDSDLTKDNPLCKIPALIVGDGRTLFDSPVICEYLDSLHGGRKLFPPGGPERWAALLRQALADGILEAMVAWRVETTMRPAELRWDGWVARQTGVIARGLDVLEAEIRPDDDTFTIGEIATVCALGFIDFRQPQNDWRKSRPRLAAWFEAQGRRPSVAATVPRE
jgi:glutathione S-transferase